MKKYIKNFCMSMRVGVIMLKTSRQHIFIRKIPNAPITVNCGICFWTCII